MKFLVNSALIFALLVMNGVLVSAQEAEEAMEEGTSTPVMEDGTIYEDEVATSTEEEVMEEEDTMTEEEVAELIEGATALETVETVEDLEGEILAVTDDEVVIGTESGEVVVVDIDTYTSVVGLDERRILATGSKVLSGRVSASGATPTVTTSSGTYNITSAVSITRDGDRVSIEDVEEGDEVVAVVDKDGNLLALELIEVLEETSSSVMTWVIIIIIILLILALIFKKKETPITN